MNMDYVVLDIYDKQIAMSAKQYTMTNSFISQVLRNFVYP